MWIDKSVIHIYLKVLKTEIAEAKNGQGIFADQNGISYLGEAIECLEKNHSAGVEHTEMRPQAWSSISTLTPNRLDYEPLSEDLYGKIVKLFLVTNLGSATEKLRQFEDNNGKANLPAIVQHLKWVVDV